MTNETRNKSLCTLVISPPAANELHNDSIHSAAQWLADNWHVAPQPITRTLREQFGLGFNDAAKAMAEARRIIARSGAA